MGWPGFDSEGRWRGGEEGQERRKERRKPTGAEPGQENCSGLLGGA